MTLATLGAHGQGKPRSFSFVPQVGVSLGKQNGFAATLPEAAPAEPATQGYQPKAQYKAGFTVGMEAIYQATSEWAVSLGAFYTQTGSKYKDFEATFTQSEQPDQERAAGQNATRKGYTFTEQNNTFGYVMIPVMAHYYLTKGFAVKAGVELGFLTNAKKEWTRTDFTIADETNVRTFDKPIANETDLKDDAKSVAFAIPVGVSYEYEHVVLDARYHIPLTKSMETIDTHNRLFTITVGYRF